MLSARHEAFAQHLAKGNTASAAYTAAYGVKGKSANEGGCRLARKDNIRARVSAIADIIARETAAREADVARQAVSKFKGTLLTATRRLEIVAEIAENKRTTPANRMRAVELDAKLRGDLLERHELTGPEGVPLPSVVPAITVNFPASFMKQRGV